MDVLKEFLESSTIHGLVYISKSKVKHKVFIGTPNRGLYFVWRRPKNIYLSLTPKYIFSHSDQNG